MKLTLVFSLLLASFQASAIILDGRNKSIRYDVRDVNVLLACDSVSSNVKNWYVLGTVNYGNPQLFFFSRGQLVLADKQINRSGYDNGEMYHISVDYLNYHFNKTRRNDYSLLITNDTGKKIDLLPCRSYLN